MATTFPHLFSPIAVGGVTLRNRIMSTGHDTVLPKHGMVSDELVAYQEARAAGGAGLIVIQVSGVHETAKYSSHVLMATSDESIPGYRRLAEACHRHGTKVFGQLFHPGREIMETEDGTAAAAFSASATPSDRFHVIPAPMSRRMIRDIVAGYAAAAGRMQAGGMDGAEIVASHGYLPAQFLNHRVNTREDDYGSSFANRLRFLREVVAAIRARVGSGMVVGLRISGEELGHDGLAEGESLEAIMALDRDGGLDYVNVIAGSSSTVAGAVHIVPPMIVEATGYVAPFAATVKANVRMPVFVAGRINQPQIAERIVASGQADVCGMTRAMICDPEMANKAKAGRVDDIRACIGCNQACIGHFHLGVPISCIQHPETGRELVYGTRTAAPHRRRILVVGGGPAGMKAAAVAAERGHDVTLHEKSGRLGGQALLAQLLPGRSEFGGIVTNLAREMDLAGVKVVKNSEVTTDLIDRQSPDALILATGGRPRHPRIEGDDEGHVVDAWQVLKGEANVGRSVVIADWRCDWIGLGLAEKLARDGCRVRLAVNGYMPGETIHRYVRDAWIGILHKLGVEMIPYARVAGVDATTVYLQHTTSGEPILCEDADTLVLAQGHDRMATLVDALEDYAGELHVIGDARAPRTAEEAVLEGLKAGTAV
ncbi:MAG: FAD-dependent oxidoreductase [Alphaproteobacteria bacterium]|nr:FAD-dependent oxidoreductase [Alphaproteobacteria bacterium]